jgi:hypothetical protein
MGRPKGEPMFPISLTVPISMEIKEKLMEEAGKAGIPMATHARLLILKGLAKK